MTAARGYLLDTTVVLHYTREGSSFGQAVDANFGLSASRFRPAVCEVTVAELKAFASAWGSRRRERLDRVMADLLVIEISVPGVHDHWAAQYAHAREHGLPIQHDHNDIWIAAAAHVAGLQLLSADQKAFLPLRGTEWVDAIILDPTGSPLA
jgi:predicted nucleic acid-binding protein